MSGTKPTSFYLSEEEIALLRRRTDQAFLERLVKVEVSLAQVEKDIGTVLADVRTQLDNQEEVLKKLDLETQKMIERQKKSEPILDSLDNIAKVSVAVKWIIVTIMGALGAVTTILSIIDYIKKR